MRGMPNLELTFEVPSVAQGSGPVARDAVKNARNRLHKEGIQLYQYSPGEYRVVCPQVQSNSFSAFK